MIENLRRRWKGMRWGILAPLLIISGIISLSAHVLILYAGIPFPIGHPYGRWLAILDLAVELVGITYFYTLASPAFQKMSWGKRWFALFLLITTVQERLLRAPLVDTFATTAFRYSLLSDSKALIPMLIACLLIATTRQQLQSWRNRVGFSIVVAAMFVVFLNPVLKQLYAKLLAHFDYLSHPGLYNFPYPWQLNVPAYILFIEPVISAVILYSLVEDRLSRRTVLNLLQFAVLLAAIRYAILGPFIYPFVARDMPAGVAIASKGQFLLEALVLGITVGASFRVASKRPHELNQAAS